MVKKIAAVLLIPLVVLGCWLSYYYSDKQVLERRIIAIAADMIKKDEENQMEATLKMRGVKGFLASKCQVYVPERNYDSVLDPSLIIRYLMYYRGNSKTLAMTVEKMDIAIPLKHRAVIQCFLNIQRETSGEANVGDAQGWLELHLEKTEGEWLVHQVSVTEALLE